jgi:hypothetical protein
MARKPGDPKKTAEHRTPRKHDGPAGNATVIRREILLLLTQTRGSRVQDVIRLKHLAEEYSKCGATGLQPEEFVSGYFNVRLARLTGEAELEKNSIRRCLEFLNFTNTAELLDAIQAAATARQTTPDSRET